MSSAELAKRVVKAKNTCLKFLDIFYLFGQNLVICQIVYVREIFLRWCSVLPLHFIGGKFVPCPQKQTVGQCHNNNVQMIKTIRNRYNSFGPNITLNPN